MSNPQDHRQVMEARYHVPYNWLHAPYSMRWAHKEGLCRIIFANLNSAQSLLDVGCGDGWYTARFAERVAEVNGVDISEQAIKLATLIVPKAKFQVAAAYALPFETATFDVVTCIQVLEHMTEDEGRRSLAEFARVLKPGGRMLISVPSSRRPMSKAHLRHYTPDQLKLLFQPMGQIITIIGHERASRFALRLRSVFENRYWTLPAAAKWFYEHVYFRYWNHIKPEQANNLVAVVEVK